jgi:nitroreductase
MGISSILSDIKNDRNSNNKNLKDNSTPLPKIDSKEFQKVLDTRRSVRVYKNDDIPDSIIKKCLENALKAPTSSNLQTWEIYWVRSNKNKNDLIEACFSQPAAKTAKELFVFVARPDHWRRNNNMMLDYLKTRNDPPKSVLNYYGKITKFAYNQGFLNIFGFFKKLMILILGSFRLIPREPTSFNDMKVWSQKTTALACQNFMLSMRAYGYDTCPMEGLDSTRVKKILKLPKKAQICMAISAGKRDNKGVYGKQLRFDKKIFIKEV